MPERVYSTSGFQPVMEVRTTTLLATLARFCVGMSMFIAVFCLGYYRERLPFIGEHLKFGQPTSPTVARHIPDHAQQATPVTEPKVAPPSPPFPVPPHSGLSALNDPPFTSPPPRPHPR